MTWRERVRGLCAATEFAAPASEEEIAEVEAALAVSLPTDLREFLREANGCRGEFALDLVWPTRRMLSDNLSFRENAEFRDLYMPFDALLFFADAGNGDQFAFPIHNGAVRRPDVFVWNHEDDSRTWVAPSLDLYLEWWLTGVLKT